MRSAGGQGAGTRPGGAHGAPWQPDRRQLLRWGAGAAGALAVGGALWGVDRALEEEKPPLREALWTYPVVDSDGIGRCAHPVTHADGVLYVRSEENAVLHALDAASGRRRWRVRLSGSTAGEPAVTERAVYTASDDGAVHALRRADGGRLWRVRPGGRLRKALPSTVWTSGSVVLVSITPWSHEDESDPAPPELHALDAADGRTLWHTEATLLSVRDGLAYVNPPDLGLVALDVRTGTPRWTAPVRNSLDRRTLDLSGAGLLFGRTDPDDTAVTELVAYDARTGEVRWTAPTTYWSLPALGGDTLYVIGPGETRDDARRLHAYDAASGRRRWTVEALATSPGEEILLSAGTEGVRLLLSADGGLDDDQTTVRAHAARDGRELWSTERTDSSYSLVTTPGNRLMVGYLFDWYAYDSRTGKPRWRVNTGEESAAEAPVAAGGRLFCANDMGVTAVRD
ncbi:PQQ-like beta-propeller repeat protein [Streptomyces boluensis]|uniref:PQQ-binding-like beta-propeller repeat protein n=1 Tax=Streptomyces boluensis TaxID=1775135 RepID=A0A964XP00_9ACTN|nr:PQQ-like beta-propeller repeat protein [Streptomyces boluensis]NBE54711.1 PQQ-binding-like beta-propeller repeat protein [Streptomyces boluensis]